MQVSAQVVRFSGILGAFGALVYYTKHILPQLRQIIVPIIVISIIMTYIQPGINTTAHIAGLIVGFLIGLSYFHPKTNYQLEK